MADENWRANWEKPRKISDDISLDCNFPMEDGSYPASLISESAKGLSKDFGMGHGRILLTYPECIELMYELADRFGYTVTEDKKSAQKKEKKND